MKNSYFNSMLNFRVELGVIQKNKKKNTLLKKKTRTIRRKYFKNINAQILIDCVERKEV
jgi:hypothetical protein